MSEERAEYTTRDIVPDGMLSAVIPITRELAEETTDAAREAGIVKSRFRAQMMEDGFRAWQKKQVQK